MQYIQCWVVSDNLFANYRIAGKFGEFHSYECLARKSLANG